MGLVGLLVALLSACATSSSSSCRSTRAEARQHPRLLRGVAPKIEEVYYFEGLTYSEFEDSGLILTSLSEDEALSILDDLKWDAFCQHWSRDCSQALADSQRSRGKRIRVARIKALVRYLGKGERGSELSPNQCRSGSLEIVALVSLKPLVEASLPE